MDKTPTQELSDVLNGLQFQLRIMEALPGDLQYEEKFHRQAWLLTDNLKKVKPLIEKIISEGYSLFAPQPIVALSGEEVSTT